MKVTIMNHCNCIDYKDRKEKATEQQEKEIPIDME